MDWGARLGVKMIRIKEENSMECERTHRTSQVSKTESRNTTLDSLVQKSRKMHKKKGKAKKKKSIQRTRNHQEGYQAKYSIPNTPPCPLVLSSPVAEVSQSIQQRRVEPEINQKQMNSRK